MATLALKLAKWCSAFSRLSYLTPAEFRRQFLGLKPLRFPAHAQKAPILPTKDLPKDFDWRDKGAVTNVKDQ
ncbi:hypothetical protein P7M70_24865, partial [Vibrio parahaemolyticus]|nr:hypothetical protein [Vibrio parahaemolyticus]